VEHGTALAEDLLLSTYETSDQSSLQRWELGKVETCTDECPSSTNAEEGKRNYFYHPSVK